MKKLFYAVIYIFIISIILIELIIIYGFKENCARLSQLISWMERSVIYSNYLLVSIYISIFSCIFSCIFNCISIFSYIYIFLSIFSCICCIYQSLYL